MRTRDSAKASPEGAGQPGPHLDPTPHCLHGASSGEEFQLGWGSGRVAGQR